MEKRLENLLRTKQYADLVASDKRYADQFVEDAASFDVLKKMAQANIGVAVSSKTAVMRKKELDTLFDKTYGNSTLKLWKTNTSLYLQPIIWGAAACLILFLAKVNFQDEVSQFSKNEIQKAEGKSKKDIKIKEPIVIKGDSVVGNKTETKKETQFAKNEKSISNNNIKTNLRKYTRKVKPNALRAPASQNYITTSTADLSFEEANENTKELATSSSSSIESIKEVEPKNNETSNAESLDLVISNSGKRPNKLKKTRQLVKVNVNDGLYYLEVGY